MKLFRGTVDMALQTGAEIVPIGIEQYGKHFYVNIGTNIRYENSASDAQKLTDELRDTLASLKWEIWEQFPVTRRDSFSDNYGDMFVDAILKEAGYRYPMELIEEERFHDKTATSPKEAFAFMERLMPCRENAFSWRKIT